MQNDTLSPYEICVERGTGIGHGAISPENMPIMHEKLLENVLYFDKFCAEHGLTYCLIWGSCIGAVRHHGFIPWDDDLDVAMPRNDFEKLFMLWDKFGDKERFTLYRTTKNFCAKAPIGLLRNNNTTVIYDFSKEQDIVHGVKIDIEAWDEVPSGRFARIIQKIYFRIFEVYATQRLPRSSTSLRKNKKLKLIIVKIMLGIVKKLKSRYIIAQWTLKKATKYNGTGCEYVRCNAVSPSARREDMFNTFRVDVAGHKLCIPKGYDSILRTQAHYGDYMEKPPVNNRVPTSDFVFYDFNSDCGKYKGVYYCTSEKQK